MQASPIKKIAIAFYIFFAAGLFLSLLIMLMELLEDGNFANSWPFAAIATGGLLATLIFTTLISHLHRRREMLRKASQERKYAPAQGALELQ